MQVRTFRSLSQMSQRIAMDSWRLPSDLDAIVGLPRSGLLVATQLGLIRHLPVSDLASFVQDVPFKFGSTRGQQNFAKRPSECLHVLLAEDSVASGNSLKEAMMILSSANIQCRVSTYAVYVSPTKLSNVDYFGEAIEYPRLFEWNFMHHPLLASACLDLDGVICHDPESDQNDDGKGYIEFLERARPKYLPRSKIGSIVTARLAKYESQTVAWLKSHNVEYDKLYLLEGHTAQQRKASRINAKYKAEIYRQAQASIFIESAEWEATEIAQHSGRAVLCTDTMSIVEPYFPGPKTLTYRLGKTKATFVSRMKAALKKRMV
jgi:uncharacterized HAD superfamily protein